jgi:hypothetical protein
MEDFFYYCFECDYSSRTKEKQFIKDCLKTFDSTEITNIGVSTNNNPYSLEFKIFLHLETEKNKVKFENWLKTNYPQKYRRYNIFTKDLFQYNVHTFVDEQQVDFALTKESNYLFLFPEREFFEMNHPQFSSKKNTPKVFLSHASEDKKSIVEPLFEYLQNKEISVWLDKYEIDYGENIYQKVSEGIDNAEVAIFVITENFLNKKWPKEELSALSHLIFNNKSLVIVSIKDGTELPKLITTRKYIQWDDGKNLSEIAEVIKRKLNK